MGVTGRDKLGSQVSDQGYTFCSPMDIVWEKKSPLTKVYKAGDDGIPLLSLSDDHRGA